MRYKLQLGLELRKTGFPCLVNSKIGILVPYLAQVNPSFRLSSPLCVVEQAIPKQEMKSDLRKRKGTAVAVPQGSLMG